MKCQMKKEMTVKKKMPIGTKIKKRVVMLYLDAASKLRNPSHSDLSGNV